MTFEEYKKFFREVMDASYSAYDKDEFEQFQQACEKLDAIEEEHPEYLDMLLESGE